MNLKNIRSVVEMKMEGKCPRGRPKLRSKDTVRRGMYAWDIRDEWATGEEIWKGLWFETNLDNYQLGKEQVGSSSDKKRSAVCYTLRTLVY